MALDPIMKLPEVVKATGVCKTVIYQMMNKGIFPWPIERGAPGATGVGWLESEVAAWIRARPRASKLRLGAGGIGKSGSPVTLGLLASARVRVRRRRALRMSEGL